MKTAMFFLIFVALASLGRTEEPAPPGTNPGEDRPARITDDHGNYQGQISPEGRVTDVYGNFQGTIKPDGRIYDSHGNYKGQIRK